jgi:hypothetical protein
MRNLSDIDCEYAALAMYGDISRNKNDNIEPEKDEVNVESQDESKVGGDESESLMLSKGESESESVMSRADEEKRWRRRGE